MSLSGKPHLNPAEKLDAIYDMLRRAERQRRFSLGVRIALIAMLAFAGFSLATDPDAPWFAESVFERYMLPRLTDMAGRMAEKMQQDLVDPSSGMQDTDMDNVDMTGFSDTGTSARNKRNTQAIIKRLPNMSRADMSEMVDMGTLDGTLESMGMTREEFLAAFPE